MRVRNEPMPAPRLTPDVEAEIVRLLRAGNFRETACAAAGVDPKSMRNWLKRGAHGEEPYASFAAACTKAEAESEAADIDGIATAGADDWKALAWRRERIAPSRWGPRVRITVDEELNGLLDRLAAALPPAEFERVLAIATGQASGPGGGPAQLPALDVGDDDAGDE